MGQQRDMMAALAGGQPMGFLPGLPSPAQSAEMEKVQAMNVRTNAANMATHLLTGQTCDQVVWLSVARFVEAYIRGD